MRFLVLDGSRVLPALLQRLVPDATVETASGFEEARRTLLSDPPDAVIVNLTPANLPWEELCSACRDHDPPIPVLFESCVYRNAAEAGISGLHLRGHFLAKPYSLPQLRAELERLTLEALGNQPGTEERPRSG